MRYIEVSIDTPAAELDRRGDELTGLGVEGFVIENEEDFKGFLENNHQYWDYVDEALEESFRGVSRIKCYLSCDETGKDMEEKLKKRFGEAVHSTLTADKDWENSWKEGFAPIEAGEKLLIVPSWLDDTDSGRVRVTFDPGIAFGNGSHATTHMCLAALEKYAVAGSRFLDLGCGSGILGIAALMLGAESAFGVDIDPNAPKAVLSNAALNGLEPPRIQAIAGDVTADGKLRKIIGGGYDCVLANIVADVIIALAPHVRPFMKKDGVFICSGIIDYREEETRKALTAAGFKIIEAREEDEWREFTCI